MIKNFLQQSWLEVKFYSINVHVQVKSVIYTKNKKMFLNRLSHENNTILDPVYSIWRIFRLNKKIYRKAFFCFVWIRYGPVCSTENVQTFLLRKFNFGFGFCGSCLCNWHKAFRILLDSRLQGSSNGQYTIRRQCRWNIIRIDAS